MMASGTPPLLLEENWPSGGRGVGRGGCGGGAEASSAIPQSDERGTTQIFATPVLDSSKFVLDSSKLSRVQLQC